MREENSTEEEKEYLQHCVRGEEFQRIKLDSYGLSLRHAGKHELLLTPTEARHSRASPVRSEGEISGKEWRRREPLEEGT